ncbi:hypothetical protein SESBI_28158 [Sesbania bispinosa]|nr:hypothetical protein SESBI_28158 [Sesbania bispinosa]
MQGMGEEERNVKTNPVEASCGKQNVILESEMAMTISLGGGGLGGRWDHRGRNKGELQLNLRVRED